MGPCEQRDPAAPPSKLPKWIYVSSQCFSPGPKIDNIPSPSFVTLGISGLSGTKCERTHSKALSYRYKLNPMNV